MLTKESKIRILENYYALDYTFFGKSISEVKVCCPFFREEYISTKGALLSVVIEMYNLINHSPKPIMENVTDSILKSTSKETARVARENAKLLVSSDSGKKSIKQSVSESIKKNKDAKIDEIVQEQIRKKGFSLAIDSMLVGRTVTESKKFRNLDSWKGKVLEEAYTTLKNALVESALSVLENKV